MKTDELISALAADDRSDPPHLMMRLLAGAFASLFLLLVFWDMRPDFVQAITKPLVMTKFALVLPLPILLAGLWPRPDRDMPLWPVLLPLALAAGLFLTTLPAQNPWQAIWGQSPLACVSSIPLLAVPPALALFGALRRTVVADPARAGLVAGLMAGALATLVYALHCDQDAPAFYTVWYSVGIAISAAAGRLAGRRWLGV